MEGKKCWEFFFNSRDESKKKKGIKIIRKMVSEEVQSFIGVQSKF